MTRDELGTWVETYERAWRTPGTELLRGLFAEDATYAPGPFADPHRGLEAIAAFWEEGRDGPDEEFTFEWQLVAVDDDTAVVRTEVQYADPPTLWRNLWIAHFDESGRCVEFEEWPIAPRPG